MPMKNLLLKILFVIGIVAVLVLFAVGIVRIVPKIVASLGSDDATSDSSSLTQEEEKRTQGNLSIITDTDQIISGDTMKFTWQSPQELSNREGMFALTYSCVTDLNFEVIGSNGTKRTLVCNTPFTLGKEPVEINLRPLLEGEVESLDTTIAILFYEPGVSLPTEAAKKTVTVNQKVPQGNLAASVLTTDLSDLNRASEKRETELSEAPRVNSTPSETSAIRPIAVSQTPADLAISTPVVSGNRVTFSVTNLGGVPSGAFTLNYTLPGDPVAVSPLQRSLNPGEELGLTITITERISGGVLSIRVNDDSRVAEPNMVNNVVAVRLGFIPGLPRTPQPGVTQTDLVISNVRTSASSVASNDTLTVTFDVTNSSERTSAFTIEITAPTKNTDVATSPDGLCALRANRLICAATAMSPQERRSYSFNINNLQSGSYQPVTVSIDTQNVVAEINESNNQGSTFVSIY